jgi:hypothetical protein
MLDKVSYLVGVTNDGSVVALLDKTIDEAKSQPKEEEPQEDEDEDSLDPGPLQRLPALPLPHYAMCASEALSRIGITYYEHLDRHVISAMVSQMHKTDLQKIITILIGTAFVGNVMRDDVEQVLMLMNEMLHLHQVKYVSGSMPLQPPPFLAVLKEMSECLDDNRMQHLLLYLQCHMKRGMGELEGVLDREPTTAFYVPDVNPEDDADVLAPREPMHQSLREYAPALLAVVHKIMAPSA